MWKDMSGILHESRPGEFEAIMNQNSGGWPAPRQGQQQNGQQAQQTAQNVQTQAPKSNEQNVMHRSADIIFLDRTEEMNRFEVKPGYDQVFSAKDDTWFAVKSAVGNGYTIKYYPLQEQKANAPVDYTQFVTRQQIEEALPRMISDGISDYVKRQEEKKNGTV